MMVDHGGGTDDVAQEAALVRLLAVRHDGERNEYWLNEEYPRLAMMVRGAAACLFYYPEEGHPGWASVGTGEMTPEARALVEDGQVEFFTYTSNEPVWIVEELVIAEGRARAAALEFFRAPERLPATIEWFEL